MKILVTGYKGFIGQNLCNYLTSQGHVVEGYDYIENILPNPQGYDWVIHIGAISSTTETDVEKVLTQNLDFTMRLLQTCDRFGVNFQYASSASVYGKQKEFKEEGPFSPQSPYAWSKYLFDRFLTQASITEFKGLVQGFRYFNVYGNHEEHKKDQQSPISKFTNQAITTGKIKVFENSKNYLRDFVCVDDICKIHELMLHQDISGIWNIGTGSAVSFEDIAQLIAKKYNAQIEYIPMPDNLKGQYQEYTCANMDKLNTIVDIKFKTVEEYLNGK